MKTKKCKDCNFCKCVYRKAGYSFWRRYSHYCTYYDKLVKLDYDCVHFKTRKTEVDLSQYRFDGVEEDIKKLCKYLADL
ncbi:MAG: hypothetical protein HDT28_00905 [Clostridiales bacterium]|nr:hypothetical protein [Clostridiales bacterium]